MKTIIVVQFAQSGEPVAKVHRKTSSCRTIEFRGENNERIPAELAYAGVCREVGCDCGVRLGRN